MTTNSTEPAKPNIDPTVDQPNAIPTSSHSSSLAASAVDQPDRFLRWGAIIGITIVIIISHFHYPEANPATTLCSFKTATGYPCPACGLTRAFCAMGKGEIVVAYNFNLFGPLLYLAMLVVWFAALLTLFGINRPFDFCWQTFTAPLFIKSSLWVIGCYWVIRIAYQFFS